MSGHTLLFLRMISKYDFGLVKLPGLSRNGPLVCLTRLATCTFFYIIVYQVFIFIQDAFQEYFLNTFSLRKIPTK